MKSGRATNSTYLLFMFCVLGLSTFCSAQITTVVQTKLDPNLRQFLQTQLKTYSIEPDRTTTVSLVSIRMNSGESETLAYVRGNGWCGSGGCTLLILKSQGDSYKVIGRTTIVQLPIRVIDKESHGLPLLGVWVQGGGILEGYEAILSFDGYTYPRNPSILPARKSHSDVMGRVVISEKNPGEPLYK